MFMHTAKSYDECIDEFKNDIMEEKNARLHGIPLVTCTNHLEYLEYNPAKKIFTIGSPLYNSAEDMCDTFIGFSFSGKYKNNLIDILDLIKVISR